MAVELLIAALKDDNIEAAYLLGEIEDRRAIKPLVAVFKDEQRKPAMRLAAKRSLHKLGWTPRDPTESTLVDYLEKGSKIESLVWGLEYEQTAAQGGRMTRQQIILWSCAYLIELGLLFYFTRATVRRVTGALVGGAAAGLLGLGAIALCEALGWWRVPFASTPYFLPLFYLGLSISLTPVYLVTWRVARRFGWRGLAVFLCAVAVIGPPPASLIAATGPTWAG